MSTQLFLGWFSEDKAKPTCQRIAEAAARFQEKWGIPATLALVHPDALCACEGINVEVSDTVRPNHYWVGIPAEDAIRG